MHEPATVIKQTLCRHAIWTESSKTAIACARTHTHCCVQGFLPESADQFIQDYVYKAFTPSIGLFLLGSTLYGLWKSRQGEPGK